MDDSDAESEHVATGRRLYRIIKGTVPTRDDFRSDQARGVALRPDDPEYLRLYTGLSMFDTLDRARRLAQRFRRQGDYIAEVTIPSEGAITVERTGTRAGHRTVWSDPDDLLAWVTAVLPVFPQNDEDGDGRGGVVRNLERGDE